MIARGRLSPTKEESGSLKGAPMSRRAERPRGLAVATPTAGSPRSGASERSEIGPGAGNDKEAGGPRQSARSVCLPTARRSASCLHGRAKRPRIFAVAKPAASPRDRQSAQRSLPGPGNRKVPLAGGTGRSPRSGRPARPVGKEEPVQGPVPGASKRSEVAPGTGRLQRPKPEGQGGLAAKRESADGPEAHGGAPLGRTGAGEDRLRRRHEVLPRRRTQPQGRAGDGWRDACTPAQGMTAMPA